MTPFTFDVRVNELVLVLTVSILVVPLAITLAKSVEVDTPLTVEVSIVPLVDSPLEEITLDVAVTPLIVVVKVLPTRD